MKNWFTEAQAFFQNAYNHLAGQQSPEEHLDVLLLIMRFLVKFSSLLSDYESAEQLLSKKLDLITEKATEDRAITVRQLANIAYEKGNYSLALERFEESLDIMTMIDEVEQSAPILTRLGDVLLAMGLYDKARDRLQQAHAIYEQFRDTRGRAQCLVNLGDMSRKIGNYDEARQYFEDAYEVFTEIEDALWQGICLVNLSYTYCQHGEYDEALEKCQHSIAIFEEIDRPWQKQYAQSVLATIYTAIGDSQRAISILDENIVNSNYPYHRAIGNISLARHYISNESVAQSVTALNLAIDNIPAGLLPLLMEWALEAFHLEIAVTGNTNVPYLHFIIDHPIAEASLKFRANKYLKLIPDDIQFNGNGKAGDDINIDSMITTARDVLANIDSDGISHKISL